VVSDQQEASATQTNSIITSLELNDFKSTANYLQNIDQVVSKERAQFEIISRIRSEYATGLSATNAEILEAKRTFTDELGALVETVSGYQADYQSDKTDTLATKTELNQLQVAEQEARATMYEEIETEFTSKQDDINTRATSSELSEAISTEQQARLTLSNEISAQFESTQDDIDTRATKTELSDVETTAEQARATLLSQINSNYTTLNNKVNTKASSTELSDAIATEQQARSTLSNSIEAQFESTQDDIDNRATKTELSTAISTEQSARATDIGQLSSTVGDNTATIQTQAESINGLKTNWAVKFQIGSDGEKRISGFGLSADGESTGAHFDVDEFSISKPGAESLDFALADIEQPNGTIKRMVVMDAANIVNLTVNDAMIESLSADKITTGKLSADRIDANGLVVSTAKSSNYYLGTNGWSLNSDGSAELNNAIFRGHIEATSGSFAGSLSAATGTFKGSLSAATGTFSGTVKADKVIGAMDLIHSATIAFLPDTTLIPQLNSLYDLIEGYSSSQWREISRKRRLYVSGYTLSNWASIPNAYQVVVTPTGTWRYNGSWGDILFGIEANIVPMYSGATSSTYNSAEMGVTMNLLSNIMYPDNASKVRVKLYKILG
jgi:hypothetical protein